MARIESDGNGGIKTTSPGSNVMGERINFKDIPGMLKKRRVQDPRSLEERYKAARGYRAKVEVLRDMKPNQFMAIETTSIFGGADERFMETLRYLRWAGLKIGPGEEHSYGIVRPKSPVVGGADAFMQGLYVYRKSDEGIGREAA